MSPALASSALQMIVGEAVPAVAERVAHPGLVVRSQVEHQHAAARRAARATASATASAGSAAWCSACDSSTTSTLASSSGSAFELAALPGDVLDVAAQGQGPGAAEHVGRAIDGDHLARPVRGLDRQVALAAAEVGDVERGQQQAEGARPGGPAAAGHQLAPVAGVGAGVPVEVLPADAHHLLQPGFVGLQQRRAGGLVELGLQQRPERPGVGRAGRGRGGSR